MRQVTQTDAPQLAQLIRETGLHDNPDPERIARVSLDDNHITLVETADDGTLIGFVDAFSTVAHNGIPRWEVDLLGVHPDYRGKGIAQRLVTANVERAKALAISSARALVHVENAASTACFLRCGFRLDATIRQLCVSDQSIDHDLRAPETAHLIPVSTLTYSGIWIEGELSQAALLAAQAIRTRYGWDVAGVVTDVNGLSSQHGFDVVGSYRWLERTL